MSTSTVTRTEAGDEYAPNSFAQWRALVSPAKLVVWSSAYGKGKTRGICEAADLDCRMSDNNLVLLYRKTLASMWDTTIKCLLEKVIDPAHAAWGWKPNARGGAVLKYPNGSELLCLGVDNPGRVKSAAYGSAYGDQAEEITEEEFEAVDGRLRHDTAWRLRHVLVMNPESKSHWIYKRYRPDRSKVIRADKEVVLPDGRILAAGRISAEVVVSAIEDNLANLPAEYVAGLMTKRGVYRARYWEGRWEAFEGQVYAGWTADRGVVKRPAAWKHGIPPIDWPRRVGIDFGYIDPFVCQWWVKTPGELEVVTTAGERRMAKPGTWICYREVYTTQTTIPDLMPQLKDLERREYMALREMATAGFNERQMRKWTTEYPQLPVAQRYSDHARQERELMEDQGWATEAAYKDIQPGVQCLFNKLTIDEGQLPGILFCEDALVFQDQRLAEDGEPCCTVDEIPLQRWKPQVDDRAAKEEPVDALNHGCDAMRYAIASDEKAGVVDVRFL